MAKTRISKKVISGVSEAEFNDALTAVASADARRQKISASMDEQITKIRDKYADELTGLEQARTANAEIVQTYCEEQKAELFRDRRSMETPHGIVGFRTGTPKLTFLKGFKLAQVLDNLKAYLPGYVRTTEEPAKDRLLADKNLPDVLEALPKIGYQIVQDESFFIELKKEESSLA